MISYQQAIEIIKKATRFVKTEEVTLSQSTGRVCAESIYSFTEVPTFSSSAMDGFVLREEQTRGASEENPIRFQVVDTIAAGDLAQTWPEPQTKDATCIWEIMTGAVVPTFGDSVVRIEDVKIIKKDGGRIREIEIDRPVRKNANVRFAGEDYRKGQLVLPKSRRVMPENIVALASFGMNRIQAMRKPRVAVLSTGKELVEDPNQRLKEGQIRNSSAPMICSYLAMMGVDAQYHGVVADEPGLFISKIESILKTAPDVIITTGAVSVGKYDFVKTSLLDMKAEILFHKVAIRPGKPVLFARFPGAAGPTFFGLPGNPVSTLVGLRFFVEPYLRHSMKLPDEAPIHGKLTNSFVKPERLKCFYKANLTVTPAGVAEVKILDGQASFMVSPLLDANVWAVLDEGSSSVKEGNSVKTFPLNSGQLELRRME